MTVNFHTKVNIVNKHTENQYLPDQYKEKRPDQLSIANKHKKTKK